MNWTQFIWLVRDILICALVGVGFLALVAMPFLYFYANEKQRKYREHGQRTGEW